jgi:hypothetical protein
MKTKKCWKCKLEKTVSEFSKNRYKRDGYASQCKPCSSFYSSKFSKTQKFKINTKRYKQSPKGKKSAAKYMLNLYKRHPEKVRARNSVQYAIRTGKLKHPTEYQCSYCISGAQQYHHRSYDKKDWLKVTPVCKLCHKSIHGT